MNPNEHTAWAVFLGCSTARLLARERRITKDRAAHLLCRAHDAKLIRRVSRGRYEAKRLGVMA
jgi:hypothetical protein